MTLIDVLVILACVLGISFGQVLFKLAALSQGTDPIVWTSLFTSPHLIAGGAIYVLSTLAWIAILRSVPLGVAYPFMALAFLIVPVLSHLFVGEPLSLQTILGSTLIVGGIVVIAFGQPDVR